jgi:hypothetical protein
MCIPILEGVGWHTCVIIGILSVPYLCNSLNVTTLTLSSWSEQRLAKVQANSEARGVTFHAHESVGECEGINPHIPKWALTLRVEVAMDSRIFKKRFQGSKLIRLKIPLYHWESSWKLDVYNGISWPIGVLKTQVMVKRRAKSQINDLIPNH